MSKLESIRQVRAHLQPIVDQHLPTFKTIEESIIEGKAYIEKEVMEFAETEYVAHKVGERMGDKLRPVVKLQLARRAIYANAKIVSHFRVHTLQGLIEQQADAKALLSRIWTELMGDDLVIEKISSNAQRESEVSYVMMEIKQISESIKNKYSIAKNRIDWMFDNLDQLNRIESALRLEHNMKLTLNDVGDSSSDDFGEDGLDLTEDDLNTVSTKNSGKTQSLELAHDPLDDLVEESKTLEEKDLGEDNLEDLGAGLSELG